MVKKHIHILGASGSGTTTLGRLLAQRLDIPHFDSDNYFWMETKIPFTEKKEISLRQSMLKADLEGKSEWVLSGALIGWGEFTIPYSTLVVFLFLSPIIRLQRLKAREVERYGINAISPGGYFYQNHQDFMEWAAGYDDPEFPQRSRAMHERWLETIPCLVIRLDSQDPLERLVDKVVAMLE